MPDKKYEEAADELQRLAEEIMPTLMSSLQKSRSGVLCMLILIDPVTGTPLTLGNHPENTAPQILRMVADVQERGENIVSSKYPVN